MDNEGDGSADNGVVSLADWREKQAAAKKLIAPDHNKDWSVEEMLEYALAKVRANPNRWSSATVIMLNTNGDAYIPSQISTNFRPSELVALHHTCASIFEDFLTGARRQP